jgi:hypothetical protein
MHLSLGQEAWPPCLLVFSFICWLFFFSITLYCVHAYQNHCYMCTKINVKQCLAPSDRLRMYVQCVYTNVINHV